MDLEEKTYELLKDISFPGHYFRAGQRKTAKEWYELFKFVDISWEKDWFMDVEGIQENEFSDVLSRIIIEEFEKRGLRSQTYSTAARAIAQRWITYNDSVASLKK